MNQIIFLNKKNLLSKLEIKKIEKIKFKYKDNHAISIESLKVVQRYRHWISDISLKAISKYLNIELNYLEEISTFYSQIFRKPVGRHVISYCDSFVCYVKNYKRIKNVLEKTLKIKTGQTTKNKRFTLLQTCCLGNCDKGPILMINRDTYTNVIPKYVNNILNRYR
ncbi:NADH-quinone oxidoreductase subunit NuoE [Candidatus Annandia adelgestsuga]|nr:NADH-quinone oxidoreductase subunit NuoE [Candidatus Annandia adelgestsuga]